MILPDISTLGTPKVADPRPMLRLHYQWMAHMLGLKVGKPGDGVGVLAYAPLQDAQVIPGAAEWAITSQQVVGGPNVGGGVLYRQYQGYTALYYALGTGTDKLTTPDAQIFGALELFPRMAQSYAAAAPGVTVRPTDFGGTGNLFVHSLKDNPAYPAVLALSVDWTLELALTFNLNP